MKELDEIVILLTLDCNIRCNYCFFKKEKNNITIEVLTKILTWFVDIEGDEKRITLLGGEPLLLFDRIKEVPRIINSANTLNKNIYFKDIHTNGTLLDVNMIKFFKEHNMILAFSLDGYSYESNYERFNGSRSLYLKTISSLKKYVRLVGMPKIKMTVVPNNSKNLYHNVKDLIKNGFYAIEINPACGYPWKTEDVDIFYGEFKRVVKLYSEFKKANKHIFINPVDRYLEESYQGIVNKSDCSLGDKIVFAPNGDAFACSLAVHTKEKIKKELFLGNINTRINLKKINKLKKESSCIDKEIKCKCRFFQIQENEYFSGLEDAKSPELSKDDIETEISLERKMFQEALNIRGN